jgi:hypothetical protein
LLGQIAGVASGGYSGAVISADIIYLLSGTTTKKYEIVVYNIVILVIAGVVNTFSEGILTSVSLISAVWQGSSF